MYFKTISELGRIDKNVSKNHWENSILRDGWIAEKWQKLRRQIGGRPPPKVDSQTVISQWHQFRQQVSLRQQYPQQRLPLQLRHRRQQPHDTVTPIIDAVILRNVTQPRRRPTGSRRNTPTHRRDHFHEVPMPASNYRSSPFLDNPNRK